MVVSIAVIKDFPAVSEVNELLTRDHARHNRGIEVRIKRRRKKKKSREEWVENMAVEDLVEENQSRRVRAELSR